MCTTTPECEILLLHEEDERLRISTYRLNEDTKWKTRHIERLGCPLIRILNLLYMKGSIYYLYTDGRLKCYSLGDKSLKVLTSAYPEPGDTFDSLHFSCWLIEYNEDIIMVCMDDGELPENWKWTIFRFDSVGMCWVVESSLKCAIFICGDVAWTTPLSECNEVNLEGVTLFYRDEFDTKGEGVFCLLHGAL